MQKIDFEQFQTNPDNCVSLAQNLCVETGSDHSQTVQISLQDFYAGKIAEAQILAVHNQTKNSSSSLTDAGAESIETTQVQHQQRAQHVQQVLAAIAEKRLISDENPAIDFYDLDCFANRLQDCLNAFPDKHFTHALAVKANPLRTVLKAAQLKGFGAECASFAEAKHSLSLGFTGRQVIYDSPCKTIGELEEMIGNGCYTNLDNLEEIEKVAQLMAKATDLSKHDKQIGLRINPILGGGKIASTSTATLSSKFGLPLADETKEKLIELYKNNKWLQGVHVHVGSQGCALEMLVQGALKASLFAKEINERLGYQQVRVLDIGGGLPTLYDGINEAYSFADYAKALRETVPAVFSGEFDVITEFGRSMFVKSGITVTRVESVKNWCKQNIAVVHTGANQFLRTAYLPNQWRHELSVFDSAGQMKNTAPFQPIDIAGPLCFSGDFIAKQRLLPPMESGDLLVIHDTGGYTLSMYSKYNSRRASAVYGYEKKDGQNVSFKVIKERETTEETLAFWGLTEPKDL